MTVGSARLTLDFHDWWHCSSGQSQRAGINVLVHRDGNLPIVPGRTVKGLLREALRQAEYFGRFHEENDGASSLVPDGATNWLLGKPSGDLGDAGDDFGHRRLNSEQGHLAVDSATLPAAWYTWAATREGGDALEDLSTVLTATAVDNAGQVVPTTLRSIEAMPPMVLTAGLTLLRPDEDRPRWLQTGAEWVDVVRAVLPLFRLAGSRRNRGLGRLTATLTVEDNRETAA